MSVQRISQTFKKDRNKVINGAVFLLPVISIRRRFIDLRFCSGLTTGCLGESRADRARRPSLALVIYMHAVGGIWKLAGV